MERRNTDSGDSWMGATPLLGRSFDGPGLNSAYSYNHSLIPQVRMSTSCSGPSELLETNFLGN
jgi:hypothetical protein